MTDTARCRLCGGLCNPPEPVDGQPEWDGRCFLCRTWGYPRYYPVGILRIVREAEAGRTRVEVGMGQRAIDEVSAS